MLYQEQYQQKCSSYQEMVTTSDVESSIFYNLFFFSRLDGAKYCSPAAIRHQLFLDAPFSQDGSDELTQMSKN